MLAGALPAAISQNTQSLISHANYILQVPQLAVLQLEHEFPPTLEDNPLSSVEKQAKVDNTRSALLWQCGQEAASVAWLNGRNSSNLNSQSGQTYSYIGIFFSPQD